MLGPFPIAAAALAILSDDDEIDVRDLIERAIAIGGGGKFISNTIGRVAYARVIRQIQRQRDNERDPVKKRELGDLLVRISVYGYTITYTTVTQEEDEEPEIENGYVTEGGHEITFPEGIYGEELCDWLEEQGVFHELNVDDLDEDDSPAKRMAAILDGDGATNPSGHPVSPGDWWETESHQDIYTGAYTTKSYHLEGFTFGEEMEVAAILGHENVRRR